MYIQKTNPRINFGGILYIEVVLYTWKPFFGRRPKSSFLWKSMMNDDIAKLNRFACMPVGTRANHGDGFQMGWNGFDTAQHRFEAGARWRCVHADIWGTPLIYDKRALVRYFKLSSSLFSDSPDCHGDQWQDGDMCEKCKSCWDEEIEEWPGVWIKMPIWKDIHHIP